MRTVSDDELRSTREGLLARGAQLRARVNRAHDDLLLESADNGKILRAVSESSRSELMQIERALERLEAGTYALCLRCGGQIEEERLRLVPYAANCRRCGPDT